MGIYFTHKTYTAVSVCVHSTNAPSCQPFVHFFAFQVGKEAVAMSNIRKLFRLNIFVIGLTTVLMLAIAANWSGVSSIFTSIEVAAQETPPTEQVLSPSALAYTRSSFTSAYTPITTGGGATQINGGTGTGDFSSSAGTADVNDGTAYVSLPFDLTYNGTTFTAGTNFLGICTNGFAYFSNVNTNASKQTTSARAALFSANPPNNTLAPYWDNLIANTASNGITGNVLFQTSGAAPNRVFTIQWGNYPSQVSFARGLNFQVKIYEGTNVIEFLYGPVVEGTITGGSVIEAAAIGIENVTGGNNNYLDALTGSSQTNNGMMTSGNFPKYNFRFAPGAPTAITGGVYNVGVGQTYRNLSEAVADVNQRGISGPITLNLTDANYDYTTPNGSNIFPILLGPVAGNSSVNTITIEKSSGIATITADGYGNNGTIGNQLSSSVISNTHEPMFGLIGADYVTMRNLNFTVVPNVNLNALSGSNVDHALLVLSSSATDGATNNVFRDISISLDRANRDSIGIYQFAPFAPNSANKYYNLTISNTFAGIWLDGGGSTTPDVGCEIGVTGTVTQNTIGGPNANDIGNGNTQPWGIRVRNQSGVKIFKNEIRNITGTGSLPVDGIILDNLGSGVTSVGSNEISGNIIHDLNGTSITSGVVSGIRENLTNNVGSVSNVFNNFIYNLNSASTANATRRIIGISSQDTGTGAAATHNIHNNSVRISATNLATSNSAFEIGSTTPVFNVRNNIFANFTGAQTAPAGHYCWASTSSSSIGGAGSVSDFNDLYIDNTTNGFVGRGATTDFATLANWQTILAGAGPDDNSISVNPLFASATNLHETLLSPTIDTGTTIAAVPVDIDGDTRPHGAGIYDIGADEAIPEIDVKGLNVSIADGDTTPSVTDDTDFGQTPVNGGTVSHVFTITNTGLALLNLSGTPRVVVGGPNAADFTVTLQPAATLVSGVGTTTFTILFDPTAGGLRSATLSIANDDPNEAPYDFAIQGVGLVPEMDVRGLNVSIPDGDVTPSLADDTDFGGVNVTAATGTHVFTISNSGLAALILSGNPRVAVSGPNAAEFVVTVQPNSPVPISGGTTTFTVVFDPAAVGLRLATLTIANDDPDENPYDFAIQGTGVAGLESDVTPRPDGDGSVISGDVIQMRRFVAGLDVVSAAPNEFQRADAAPRISFGDGTITSGDVVQARRYVTGLDPPTDAGGPIQPAPVPPPVSDVLNDVYAYFFGREITIGRLGSTDGLTVSVPVEMEFSGDEAALSFTLEYDAARLSNPRLELGEAFGDDAVLTVNTDENGRIAVLVDSATALVTTKGAARIVVVTFDAVKDADGFGTVSFSDAIAAKSVSDAFGNSLPVRWMNQK